MINQQIIFPNMIQYLIQLMDQIWMQFNTLLRNHVFLIYSAHHMGFRNKKAPIIK